uniref:LEM domain-containing protein n=1 Tax=Panagrolaimus sp. PS1159 TaxID=55785 RepID=A0AC35FPT9_9BILA
MSNIYDELSNEELREELLQRGFPNAPITSETRKVYIRKLMNLTASGDADFNAPPHLRPLIDFGDETEAINGKTTNDMPSVEDNEFVILEDTPNLVENDSNEDAATSFNHESDESDYHETSRILTPEESRYNFISSVEHRRKFVKSAPSRIPGIIMFILGILTAYGIAYFLKQNMDNNYLYVKVADDEL